MYSLVLIVILGLILVGKVLIAYGTHAKKKWGINRQPVSCPRCKTQLPPARQPQSLRQALWGGWTCHVCGIEADKWGREVAPVGPRRRSFIAPDEYRKRIMKRIMIVFVSTVFCGFLTFHLLMTRESRLTFTGFVVSVVVGLAIVETTIGALIFYFIVRHRLKRLSSARKGADSAQAHESGRTQKA